LETATSSNRPTWDSSRAISVVAKIIRLHDKEHCKLVAQPTVDHLQPNVDGSSSHSLCPAMRVWPKGQRRIDGPQLPAHHRDLRSDGDEALWCAGVSIDPSPIALELWGRSH